MPTPTRPVQQIDHLAAPPLASPDSEHGEVTIGSLAEGGLR